MLRELAAELRLPEPLRSRLIVEVAADMAAMYDALRAEGVEEDEAARRTEESLAVSPEAVRALLEVHASGVERWLSRGAWAIRSAIDVLLFAAGVVPLLAAAGAVVAMRIAGGEAGGLVFWAILGMAAALLVLSALQGARIVRPGRQPLDGARRGLSRVLALGGVTALLGAMGFAAELYRAAELVATGGREAVDPIPAAEVVMRAGTSFTIALLAWVAASLIWLVLSNRLAVLEQAEAAALTA